MQGVRATLLPAKSFGQLPVSALIHFWTLRGTEAGKYPFAPLIFLYPPLIILFVCSWTLKAAQVYGVCCQQLLGDRRAEAENRRHIDCTSNPNLRITSNFSIHNILVHIF